MTVLLLDIDGTLVDHSGRLPDGAARAVAAARAAGHRVVLCTGRSRAEIEPALWALSPDALIGGNGSYVELDGGVLHHQTLPIGTVTEALGWMQGQGLDFYLECNSGLYGTDGLPTAIAAMLGNAWQAGQQALTGLVLGRPFDALIGADVNKISFILRDGLDLAALGRRFEGRARIDTWSLDGSGPQFGEFGQIGIDKGRAVRLLRDHLGVGTDELIGFGDAGSDLPMFAECGTSVAMGQAPEQVRRAADIVTGPVDADGLAMAFGRLGLIPDS